MCPPDTAGARQLAGRPAGGQSSASELQAPHLVHAIVLVCARAVRGRSGWAKTVGRPAGSTHHGSAAGRC